MENENTENEENAALAAMAAFANAFQDARGRLKRACIDPFAVFERSRTDISTLPKRRPSKSILDFKRDLTGENVLLGRRWGVRGTVVMIVSSTGTGKSVVQTQMAVSFAMGIPCCGLTPKRPFNSWVIQSEDDDDRVATDRDDIFTEMSELHPNIDFDSPAMRDGVRFVDFTSFTGAKFIEELERELFLTPEAERPACIFINPMNAYFGGSLKEGVDCSAFFKGGYLNGQETRGLEYVAKHFNVLVIIFGHTPKPPTPKELGDWVDDPNICYKMCGASEIADAVRSILVFLRCPDSEGTFVFNAGKNGNSLGWTDANGMQTTKSYWRWASSGRHFWEEVPKDEWPGKEIERAEEARTSLDEDVSLMLSRMAAPGLNLELAIMSMKEIGVSQKRARSAFYEIVRNPDKYHVVKNVVPGDNGHFKTLFHTTSAGVPPSAGQLRQDSLSMPSPTGQYEIDDPLF